jgi:hypothetical protein
MEKALYGPAGRSRLKVALAVAGTWLIMLLWFAAWSWPIRFTEWVHWNSNVIALVGFVIVPLHVCALAQSSILRSQYHAEWARLPIDMPS